MTRLSQVTSETSPSSLHVLSAPFAFSQTTLLSPAALVKEARQRGVTLDETRLQLLHRRRALTPVFSIHNRAVGEGVNRRPTAQSDGVAWQVYLASAQGRLRDPAQHRFRPWPRRNPGMLYSQFQLLGLRQLQPILDRLTATRTDEGIKWDLPQLPARVQEFLSQTRALALMLELLAPRYLPRVRQSIRSPSDDMYRFIESRPIEERAVLDGLDPSAVFRQAEQLLLHASGFDPLGKWHRVVRIADPARWSDLRFEALLAVEYRVAAELLLLYHEDLVELGEAPAPKTVSTILHELRHDRLTTDFRERSETLFDFRLESTPAVVLAVEGDTEMTLVPRVLDMMGVGPGTGLIEVINLKSVNGDVKLMARSVAVPRLDPDGFVGARVLRPLTALFVAVDPEGPYRTATDVEVARQQIVDEVRDALPIAITTPTLRSELEHLVKIETWGQGGCFEFAHFSDHQLATAIRRLVPSAPPLAKLKQALALARRHGSDIKNTWKNWYYKPSKVKLAEELWPILEKKLVSARATQLPVVRVVSEAMDLAIHVRPIRELRVHPD